MGWQGKRGAALASLLAAFAFALSACGDDDSSNESASSSDAGSQAATGATGSTGSGGATGKSGSAPTGGSKAPSTPKKGAIGKSSPTSADPGNKRTSKKKDERPVGLDNPDAGILANFYTQAKEVCKILTLSGLAHEYEVAATPDAVAKAYSKSYPKNQRGAVYKGCRDGVR
jgi:hypothetical protein